MNHQGLNILFSLLRRKLVVLLLLGFSAFAAFATLGDGKGKDKPGSLLSRKTERTTFSLKSGYTYRGYNVINRTSPRFVSNNTTITYQRGHTTYTVPVKKLLLDNKLTFNPNAATRR